MDLKNKVIVITGGTKGLGKALANRLKQEDANVVVSSRFESGDESVMVADIKNENAVMNLAKIVVQKFGHFDIWINNVGIWMPRASVEDMDMNRAHEMLEVNLFGTIYGSKAALIQMREQNSGMIVNILSTAALYGSAQASMYCASKFAVDGFTKSLRCEVENSDIKIVAVYPGGMKTNFFDEQKPEVFEDFMNPDDVAEKIVRNLKAENPEEELILKRPAKI